MHVYTLFSLTFSPTKLGSYHSYFKLIKVDIQLIFSHVAYLLYKIQILNSIVSHQMDIPEFISPIST